MDWSHETYSVRWPLGLTISWQQARPFAIRDCIAKVKSKIARRAGQGMVQSLSTEP
jgi:hypothetical protein